MYIYKYIAGLISDQHVIWWSMDSTTSLIGLMKEHGIL